MDEGVQATDTEDTLDGGAIVLPTEPPPQPATSSNSIDAIDKNPRRSFKPLSPECVLRVAYFCGQTPVNSQPHPSTFLSDAFSGNSVYMPSHNSTSIVGPSTPPLA
jgi:hypothetical protein